MKLLFAICMLTFSTITLADVTASDIRNAVDAMKSACASNSNSRECSEAFQREQAVLNQSTRETGEAMNRAPGKNQRREQIRQEEKWRDEYHNK